MASTTSSTTVLTILMAMMMILIILAVTSVLNKALMMLWWWLRPPAQNRHRSTGTKVDVEVLWQAWPGCGCCSTIGLSIALNHERKHQTDLVITLLPQVVVAMGLRGSASRPGEQLELGSKVLFMAMFDFPSVDSTKSSQNLMECLKVLA